jgi:hypothetical protein
MKIHVQNSDSKVIFQTSTKTMCAFNPQPTCSLTDTKPASIVNQAPGPGVKRIRASSPSDTAAHVNAMARNTQLIRRSEFPDFVFTSLSDAIKEWQDTRNIHAKNDLTFNILATVKTWSKPQQSKGVNSSNIFAKT